MGSKILDLIKPLKKTYQLLGLSEQEITSTIRACLAKYEKNSDLTEEQFISSLKNDLTNSLNILIRSQIESNNYQALINFINHNISKKDNKKDNLEELNKIYTYLKQIAVLADIDLYNTIINKCPIIEEIIVAIISTHYADIKRNKISKITKNPFTRELIEAYCISNSLIKDFELVELPVETIPVETDSYFLYMSEIPQKLLTPEEEKILSAEVQEGNITARHKFVESNLLLVVSIAKRYHTRGLDLLDLIQEGNSGLLKAVERYDYSKGTKFSTYATWWIRHSITRAIAETSRIIRIPTHYNEKIIKYKRAIQELRTELLHEPTPLEIQQKLGWNDKLFKKVEFDNQELVSLNQLVGVEDNDTELIELITYEEPTPEEVVLSSFNLQEFITMFARSELTKKEITILAKRFSIGEINKSGRTLAEISKLYGVTNERIRQIEAKALAKLKKTQEAQSLYWNAEIQNIDEALYKAQSLPEDYEGLSPLPEEELIYIINIMWDNRFNFLTNNTRPFRNALMFGLKYGAIPGKRYSTYAIAKTFNLDLKTTRDIIFKTSLLVYKEYLKDINYKKLSLEEQEEYLLRLFK